MRSFPMFFKTTGRRIIVAGGGEQAAQKCRLLLKSDADIQILANDLDDELAALVKEGRASHTTGVISGDSFKDAPLAFVATGCPAADVCLHDLAKQGGALVNVVDRPALCDITTPSIVDRDPVVVAIGTEGTAPVLARRIKTDIEQMLDPNIGRFAAAVGRMRDMVARYVPQSQRRVFWRQVFDGPIWAGFRSGAERKAMTDLKDAIKSGTEMTSQGALAVIDTSAPSIDLLSLRAVERLQEADEIFYESPEAEAILELARRDAERHILGGAMGGTPWPAHMCVSFVKRSVIAGKRVVWLRNFDETSQEALANIVQDCADYAPEMIGCAHVQSPEKQAFSAPLAN